MKTFHDVPASLLEHDAERSLPPGGGLLIAIGGSILFWATVGWMVFR